MSNFREKLLQSWYQTSSILTYCLLPFSVLYRLIITIRLLCYKLGLFDAHRISVPVVVVGNITVGGTGKTPLTIYLAELLKKAGYRPGIISRGYGGDNAVCREVTVKSNPRLVGDEPLLLFKRTGCPVVIGRNRVEAAQTLLADHECDVILTDDGLQHYALQRDIEIAVVDGARRLGNRHCLPAGPLREPMSRLAKVDFIVSNGAAAAGEFSMQLIPGQLTNILSPQKQVLLESYRGKSVHAVAAIGNPSRFFATLQKAGLNVVEHAFPDHHFYKNRDVQFTDALSVIMTEKDAVKCESFNDHKLWCLPINAQLPEEFPKQFLAKLQQKIKE